MYGRANGVIHPSKLTRDTVSAQGQPVLWPHDQTWNNGDRDAVFGSSKVL